MYNERIKKEKTNTRIKGEYKNMDIDEDDENIFNDQGNLNQMNIKKNEYELDFDDFENDEEITDKDSWKVIRAYFNQHGLVSQQIGSFNQFIDKNIQEIIDENRTIIIDPDVN